MQGGYPPSGYPPYGAPPPTGYGAPPAYGAPPPTGYGAPAYGAPPPTGYGGAPPAYGGGGGTTYTKVTQTTTSYGGTSGFTGIPPPSTGFNNSWFAGFYNQMGNNELYELQSWFQSVDRDRSGTITANELAGITFNGAPLGYQVAAKMIQVFDRDRSGSISFYEYAALHKFLMVLQNAFFAGDRDRSGRLDSREIHVALGVAGFNQLSYATVQALTRKYDTGYGITFPDFLMVCATVAQARSLFEVKDTRRTGQLSFNLDQLLEIVGLLT